MKKVIQVLWTFLLLMVVMGCKEQSKDETRKPEVVQNTSVYIGKFYYTKGAEKVLKKTSLTDVVKLPVQTGCECDEGVGKFSNTEESMKEGSIKDMFVAGDLLEYLKTLDKTLLEHTYVTYTNLSNQSEIMMVTSVFLNVQDNVPLEKLTRYTAGISTSLVSVGTAAPANHTEAQPRVVVKQPQQKLTKEQPDSLVSVQEKSKKEEKIEASKKAESSKKAEPAKKVEPKKDATKKPAVKKAAPKSKSTAQMQKNSSASEEKDESKTGFIVFIVILIVGIVFFLFLCFSEFID